MLHHSNNDNDNDNNDDMEDYHDENEKIAWIRIYQELTHWYRSVAMEKCGKEKKNDLRIHILSVRSFSSADEFIIVCHCFIGIIIRNDVYYIFVKWQTTNRNVFLLEEKK